MADFLNFKIEPSDHLGTANEAFKTDMMQSALSDPTQYFKLRKEILLQVKTEAVSRTYAIYYYLLHNGHTSTAVGADSLATIIRDVGDSGNS